MSTKRTRAPSKAVTTATAIGTPAAVIGGYVAAEASRKWGIPLEVAGSLIAVLAHGFTVVTSWFARGGRKGEAD